MTDEYYCEGSDKSPPYSNSAIRNGVWLENSVLGWLRHRVLSLSLLCGILRTGNQLVLRNSDRSGVSVARSYSNRGIGSFFTRWLDQRGGKREREALFVKELFRDWNTRSWLGSCEYSPPGIRFEGPRDPVAFDALPEKAKQRLRDKYPMLFKPWDSLKTESNDMVQTLKALYERFNETAQELSPKWLGEVKSPSHPSPVEYSSTIDVGHVDWYTPGNIIQGAYNAAQRYHNHQSPMLVEVVPDGPRWSLHAGGLVLAVTSEKKDVDSLKSTLEVFVLAEETALLIEAITDLQEIMALRQDPEDFDFIKQRIIEEINWEYLLREEEQSGGGLVSA